MASCISESMKNMLTSPNSKNGLGDMRYRGKRGFNDGLAKSGVWWAGTPRVVTGSILSIRSMQVPLPVPHCLSTMGRMIFLDVTSVWSLPLYGLAHLWHLISSFPGHLFPFLCFEFTNRISLHENYRHLPSLCLPRLSSFVTLTATGYCISKFSL